MYTYKWHHEENVFAYEAVEAPDLLRLVHLKMLDVIPNLPRTEEDNVASCWFSAFAYPLYMFVLSLSW